MGLTGFLCLCALTVATLAQTDNETIIPANRFCGMAQNATCFCCQDLLYAGNVATQTIAALIVSAVIFLLFGTGVCVSACCCRHEDEDAAPAGPLKFGLMGIPLFLLLVGIILLIIGHFMLSPPFTQGQSIMDNKKAQLGAQKDQFYTNLTSTGLNFTTTAASWNNNYASLFDKSDNFSSFMNYMDILRNFLAWVSVALAVAVGATGCCFIHNGKDVVMTVLTVTAFVLILGASTTIGGLNMVGVVSSDVCLETSYGSKGMLALINAEVKNPIRDVNNDLTTYTSETANQGCVGINQFCSGSGQLCFPACDDTTYMEFGNETILDGAVLRDVIDCATQCVNATLKSYATTYANTLPLYNQLLSITADLERLAIGYDANDTKAAMRTAFCDPVVTSLSILYAACALYILGCLASLLVSVIVERKWSLI